MMSEQIAKRAAALYGQDWDTLPLYSKDIWLALVRDTQPGGGDTAAAKCAGKALADAVAVAPTVDDDDETPKPKLSKPKK